MNSASIAITRELIRQGVRLSTTDTQQLALQLGESQLSDSQQQAIQHSKAEIISWLGQDNVSCLSPQQQRLWFLADIGQSQHYHVSTMAKVVSGSLNLEQLQPALIALAKQHESLRLCIPTLDDTPYLRITPPDALENTSLKPQLQHLTIDNETTNELSAEELIAHPQVLAALNEPFTLETGPLWRCICVEHHSAIQVLILSLHHIICDAWSMQTAIEQLNQLTTSANSSATLSVSPWQYSGYASWQQQKQHYTHTKAKDFWLQQILGATPLQLPSDKAQSATTHTEATARVIQELLTSDEFSLLQHTAKEQQTTPFVLYLAGLLLTFAPISQQQDFSVGMPSANRKEQSWQEVFGFFVNTLLLRLRGKPQQNIKSLIADLTAQLQQSQSFQDFPIETLLPQWRSFNSQSHVPDQSQTHGQNHVQNKAPLNKTHDASSAGQTPLFNALVNYTPPIPKYIELAGAQLAPILPSSGYAKFDLTMSFIEFSNEAKANHAALVFEFDNAQHSEQQVTQWAQQLKQTLLALTENTEQTLSAFNFPQQQKAVLANTQQAISQQNTAGPFEGDHALLLKLLDIWRQVFENNRISITDDFFAVGGHSLLAVTLAKRINQKLSLAHTLSTLQLLQNPSVEKLAQFLQQRSYSSPAFAEQSSNLHTLSTGELTFIFPGLPGSLAGYQQLANQLTVQNQACTVIGMSYPGIENNQVVPASTDEFIEQLCQQLTAKITALQPQKLSVVAHSFGATVALACIAKLSCKIDRLTLIDAAPHQPNSWQQVAKLNGVKANSQAQQMIETIQFQQFLTMRFSEIKIAINTQQPLAQCFKHLASQVTGDEFKAIQYEWNAVQQLLSYEFDALLQRASEQFTTSNLGEKTQLIIAEDSQNWLDKEAWEKYLKVSHVTVVEGDHFSVLTHVGQTM